MKKTQHKNIKISDKNIYKKLFSGYHFTVQLISMPFAQKKSSFSVLIVRLSF